MTTLRDGVCMMLFMVYILVGGFLGGKHYAEEKFKKAEIAARVRDRCDEAWYIDKYFDPPLQPLVQSMPAWPPMCFGVVLPLLNNSDDICDGLDNNCDG